MSKKITGSKAATKSTVKKVKAASAKVTKTKSSKKK
jgi:hypothetical protein